MKDDALTLRLSRDLALALRRWAQARGVPKSEVVREAVARYLTPHAEPAGRTVTARDLKARWAGLPHLTCEEGAAFADDVADGRGALGPVHPAWE